MLNEPYSKKAVMNELEYLRNNADVERCKLPDRELNTESIYQLLHVIMELDPAVMPSYRRHKFTQRGKPMSSFTPRISGPMSPGRKFRDGQRGKPTFEAYGCITSAAELGKEFGCLAAKQMHEERIMVLADEWGLIEYETYKPKYVKKNMKLKPYWYTRLVVTPKGLEFMTIYERMIRMIDDEKILCYSLNQSIIV